MIQTREFTMQKKSKEKKLLETSKKGTVGGVGGREGEEDRRIGRRTRKGK